MTSWEIADIIWQTSLTLALGLLFSLIVYCVVKLAKARMIRKLILFAFLLGLAQSAWAVPALVRKCPAGGINGGNNTGTTVTCACASNTAGNMIFVWGGTDASSGTITVADSPSGNTYTAVSATLNQAQSSLRLFAAYNIAASAGTNTITITSSVSTANLYCGAAEYSGLATTSALDQQNSNSITVGTTAWSSNNVTTTVASELWVGVAMGGVGSGTLSAGTNVAWALEASTTNGSRSPGWEDFIASATDTRDAQFTYSTAVVGWCAIATFKTPAAAGGGASKKKKVLFY